MPRSDLELEYKLLEGCILSGQVSGRQLAQMMRGDPKFAEWLRARASARQRATTLTKTKRLPTLRTAAPPVDEDTGTPSAADDAGLISLISLAAWLHRASIQAEAAADAIGAARLAQASAVVKEAADLARQEQSIQAPRPIAANQD
jgi:hypothetical protein